MTKRELRIAPVDDLQDGEMKTVKAGADEILLAKVDGRYHALYPRCSHYGAPLVKGALQGRRLVCPWHHACFDIGSGACLEPPALDALPAFALRVEDGAIVIEMPEDVPAERVTPMSDRAASDERVYAIVGAGAAGAYAAEALRQGGYGGRIVLITQEQALPYDRPKCSKNFLQGAAEDQNMPLRSPAFYEQYGIEVMTGYPVSRVDVGAKTVLFAQGETLRFDKAILCSGARPRRLDVPGADLPGVYTLRSWADSKALREAAQQAKNAVVIGASFIAMEVVWSLRKQGLDVTVVAPDKVPFEPVLGSEIGRMLRAEHERNGVRFELERKVTAMEGQDRVRQVILDNGAELPADLVVIGIGVSPATDFIHGLELAEDGGIRVDAHLKACDDVYAAGDIARFPDWRTNKPTRIEHWRLASQHGRVAGYNAAGHTLAYRGIPFFWTAQFGVKLRYVGHAPQWDEVIFDGDLEGQEFIAYYVKDDQVLAAAGVNRDREMAAIELLLQIDSLPPPQALKNASVDLLALLTRG